MTLLVWDFNYSMIYSGSTHISLFYPTFSLLHSWFNANVSFNISPIPKLNGMKFLSTVLLNFCLLHTLFSHLCIMLKMNASNTKSELMNSVSFYTLLLPPIFFQTIKPIVSFNICHIFPNVQNANKFYIMWLHFVLLYCVYWR